MSDTISRTKDLRHIYRAEYNAWQTAKQRCTNPNNPAYHNYGGRGISMSAEWVNDFNRFLEDMGAKPRHDLMLDRENNDGNYAPGNARWVTRAEQNRNYRRNHRVVFRGQQMVLEDFAKQIRAPSCYVIFWLKRGLDIEAIAKNRVNLLSRPKPPDGHKICSKCSEIKPLELFPRDRNKSLGRRCSCRECDKARQRQSYKEKLCKQNL